MQWDNPGFVPNDPRGMWNNPGGTLPYPSPKNAPVGLWNGGQIQLVLGAAIAGTTDWRQAIWRSPVFDLRPDIRGMAQQQAGVNGVSAVPIWRAAGLGAGGSLWVQINGLNRTALATQGLRVSYFERTTPNELNNLNRVTDRTDLSSEFVSADNRPNALLQFQAPGSSFTVRFWQIQLIFTWTQALAATPVIGLQAAYY